MKIVFPFDQKISQICYLIKLDCGQYNMFHFIFVLFQVWLPMSAWFSHREPKMVTSVWLHQNLQNSMLFSHKRKMSQKTSSSAKLINGLAFGHLML